MDLGIKKPVEKKAQIESTEQEFTIAKLYLWLKSLESKINNLQREVTMLKDGFTKKNNETKKELKTINEDVIQSKREKEKISEKLDLMVKELKRTAGIEEVMVLKKYLEFWNPVNFVTQHDLERVVESKLNELKKNVPITNIKTETITKKKEPEKHGPFR